MKKKIKTPWNASLDYLAKKNRSEKNVSDYLLRCGFEQEETDQCIERLKAKGFLDDKNYALKTLLQKYRQKNDSLAMMRQRLKREGIDKSIIEEVMASIEHEYEEKAFENFIDKETRYKDENDIAWQKIYRKALRLGFDQSLIYLHAEKHDTNPLRIDIENEGEDK